MIFPPIPIPVTVRLGLHVVVLAILLVAPCSAQHKKTADYIRYTEPSADSLESASRLETAISRFQKGNHTIDLVAVVHLGDTEYFDKLNETLTSYDAVLYEMVGGDNSQRVAGVKRPVHSDPSLANVQNMQQMAVGLLKLDFQLDRIDYSRPNFIHADLTQSEVDALGGSSQLMPDIMSRAMKAFQNGGIAGMPSSEADGRQMMMVVMGAVMSGDSNQLKRSLAPILAESEDFIKQLEGEEGSIIITKRNQKVIASIDALKAKRGNNATATDAVLYGAGHMPDLEERLMKMGYQKKATVWQSGWKIDKNPPPASSDGVSDLFNNLGGLLEMLK